MSKIYKELIQLNKNNRMAFLNEQICRHFSKENIQMASRQHKTDFNYQRNLNENQYEISTHICENGLFQKD